MVKQNYDVIWDDEAKSSLRRIYNYIKKRESIEQAILVRDEIKDLAKRNSLEIWEVIFVLNPYGVIKLYMKPQKNMLLFLISSIPAETRKT